MGFGGFPADPDGLLRLRFRSGHQLGGNACRPAFLGQRQRIRETVLFIDDEHAVRFRGGKPFLTGKGLQKVVRHHHKADGCGILSEMAQQPVIAAALCHRVSHAVGIGLEHDACIVMVLA